MKIRPEKEIHYCVVFLLGVSLCASFLIFIATNSLVVFAILFCLGAFLTVRFWFAFGRYMELNATGLTISFLIYKKTINWEEVWRVRVFDASKCYGYKSTLSRGVEIFLRKASRPAWLDPTAYCFFFNTANYVFLSFLGTAIQPNGMQYPVYYEVSESDLMEKLREWGVKTD